MKSLQYDCEKHENETFRERLNKLWGESSYI